MPADALLSDSKLRKPGALAAHLADHATHLEHLKELVVTGVRTETISDVSDLRRRLPNLELIEERPKRSRYA